MFGKTPLHPRADACDINSDLTISEIDIEIFKLGLQLLAKANSTPAPAVQPALTSLKFADANGTPPRVKL